MKVIQYENGVTELRTYSEVIGSRGPCSDLLICKQVTARANNRLKEQTVYNPFLEEEMGVYDLDMLEEFDRKKRHSMHNSYSRTVQKIYTYARQCEWEYFLTITFKDKAVRYDFSKCMSLARNWFHNQRVRYATAMKYLIVPEQHKDGAWHIHGLVADCGYMKFADSGVKFGNKVVYNLEDWDNGFTTAVKIDDTHKVSSYITKYITKDLCAVTQGKQRYYRSQNIPEPQEDTFLVLDKEKEEFTEMLVDSLGVKKVYEKNVGGYTGVNYKYYQSEVET